MKRVLFLTKYPTPYRVEFFRLLGLQCDLTVLFEDSPENQKHRNPKWFPREYTNFRPVFLKAKKWAKIAFDVVSYLKDPGYDVIIVGGYAMPTEMLAIQWLKNHKKSYYIEVDGIISHPCNKVKAALKTHFIRGARGYFSPSVPTDRELIRFGAEEARILRYPFSSVNQADILTRPLTAEEKQALRQKLNIPYRHMLVFVGSFGHCKGVDVLLEALSGMKRKDIGVYIIGGIPTEEHQRFVRQHRLANVHFVDFLEKEERDTYLCAADCAVVPSRSDIWGLVVNEQMAKGLPVISSDRVGAALALIDHKRNGYIFRSEDGLQLRRCIQDFFENQAESRKMAERSLTAIAPYCIENMVQAHVRELERQ